MGRRPPKKDGPQVPLGSLRPKETDREVPVGGARPIGEKVRLSGEKEDPHGAASAPKGRGSGFHRAEAAR
jgi:hypothetical protein